VRRPALVLAALVGASTLLRFWAGTLVPTPWITPDEVIYGEHARTLYRMGAFEVLGRPQEFLSLVYPVLLGPFLALADVERGYHWVKLWQALVMSLTAVPVYFWARSLAGRAWALVAAALTLAIPGLAYSGLLMTEVAFYPAVVLAAFAMARALAAPTRANQALVVGGVALGAMTRLQAFVLVPVFVSALALKLVTERRVRAQAARFLPALAGLALLCVAWAGWRLRHGGPLNRVFGAYEPAGESHYALGDAARFVLWHAADVVLLTGLFPACAVALLWAARDRSEPLRAYLAVATVLPLWFAAEVGVFASTHVGYLAERNLIPLAPLLFVGFAAWLARGGPRPRMTVAAVAVGALLLVVAMPLKRLAPLEAFPNSFTLLPLIRLHARSPGFDVDLLGSAVAAAALAVFALLPRRALWILPAVLLVSFAGISVWASREIHDRATFLETMSTGPDHRWVDRRADGSVAYLFIGEFNWPGAWENLFWNHTIDRAYDLLGVQVPGGLPQQSISPRDDGRLVLADGRPARADYVVSQYPVAFAGRAIGTAGDGLVLWRLKRPFRITVWTQRVAGHIRVLVYGCRPGRLRLGLLAQAADTVELRRNGRPYKRFRLAAGETWSGAVPAQPPRPVGRGLCTFDVLSGPELTAPGVEYVRGRAAG
jgi:4-amino-4-deoxy-L-arabinose transferase-like glycosyltransferase